MILVDSSVWIDFFNQQKTPANLKLTELLQDGVATVAVADLVVFEVLRGFRTDRALQLARDFLLDLPTVEIGGIANALQAAEHDRAQRLLDATDLIKFARSGGGAALFDALDADLRAVIAAMRPAPAPKPEPGDV